MEIVDLSSDGEDCIPLPQLLQIQTQNPPKFAPHLLNLPQNPDFEEVARKAHLGIMCFCRRRNPRSESEYEFDVRAVLNFVRDIAVSPCIEVEETAKVVKFSAQVNGYRQYVSACRTSGVEVGSGFSAERVLGFLKGLGVGWGGDDEGKREGVGREVELFRAYRRFVTVRPDWVYRPVEEVEDGEDVEEDGEGSLEDISDSSSVDGIEFGVSSDSDADFTNEIGEEEWEEILREQMWENKVEFQDVNTKFQEEDNGMVQEVRLEDSVICMESREDYSIFDLDEQYESIKSNPLEFVANCSGSAGENSYLNEDLQMEDFCDDSSSPESDADDEIACSGCSSHVMDSNQKEENESALLATKESTDSSQRHNENRTLDKLEVLNEPKLKQKESVIDGVEHVIRELNCEVHPYDEITELRSGYADQVGKIDNISCSIALKETPEEPVNKKRRCEPFVCFNGVQDTTVSYPARPISTKRKFSESLASSGGQCEGITGNTSLKSSTDDETPKFIVSVQPFKDNITVTNGDDADQSETVDVNHTSGALIKEAEGSTVANKGGYDQFTSSEYINLQKTIPSSPGIVAFANSVIRHHSSTGHKKVLSHGEEVVASTANDKNQRRANFETDVKKLPSKSKGNIHHRIKDGNDIPPSSCMRSLNRSHKSTSHNNKWHDPYDWRRLYSTPLIRNSPVSPNKPWKVTSDGKLNSFPKSLHMKFPREFTLPTKEEIEKKFKKFGPLDQSRTKVSLYTGAAQVFFLSRKSNYAAYKYVKEMNIFSQPNVCFWVDQYENYRRGTQASPVLMPSSLNLKSAPLNLKSCLKRPDRVKKKRHRVHFQLDKQPSSICTKVT